tara:strand:- start:338 stop:955 length:618 start_codon:yes stop_codon:yes gene_type:complete
MPSIKDHESKKKKKHGHAHHAAPKKHSNERLHADEAEENEVEDVTAEKPKAEKRRPSQLDADAVETKGQPVGGSEEFQTSSVASGVDDEGFVKPSKGEGKQNEGHDAEPESFQSFSEGQKFELNFPGSFILKAKAPKAFDLVERVAGDWVNDGKFESLPVGHPLAQILASKALTKAKSIEKNVLNSTPVTLAKIGLEYAKSKIKR